MTFNQYLLKILQNITETTLTKKDNKLEKLYHELNITANNNKYDTKESSKQFYDTTIDSLDYKKSKTFFTEQFQNDLNDILCTYPEFKKMSIIEKKRVQEQLWNLSLKEFEWKIYNKRLIRETSSNVPYYFKNQFEKFKLECNKYIFPTKEQLSTQRAYKNYFDYKIEIFLRFIFKNIIELNNFNSIMPVLELTSDDYKQIVKEYISLSFIFNDILKTAVKLAHDNLFNDNNTDYYNDNALVVYSNYLRDSFQFVFAMNLINATLNYCNEKKKIRIDVLEISKPIQTYLLNYKSKYATHENLPWGIHCDNSAIILDIFESCDVFTDIVTETKYNTLKNKFYSQKKLILPKYLETDVTSRPLKFPNIIKPPLLTKLSEIDYLIKPIVSGERHVAASKELINCLNYSRSKKFKISESFYLLAKSFSHVKTTSILYNYLSTEFLDVGFPTCCNINEQNMFLNKLNSYQTRLLPLYLTNNYKNQILGNTSIIINNYSNLLKLALNTEIESVHYLLKEHEFIKLKSMEMELKFARTTIEMAGWLLNFPIYITDNMCARLRLYPVEHWISRTSGVLKHLLCDYNSITLTVKGLISLLQAYYASDKNSSKSLDIYICSNTITDNNSSKNKKLLYKFFHNNYLDFTKIKNTLYFMHLHMELIKSEKTNKTDVNVELDQTAIIFF